MRKGDRVRHRQCNIDGTIVREVNPDTQVYIQWELSPVAFWCDPNEFVVLSPLEQLAECAE